jgi:TPR repeat protein
MKRTNRHKQKFGLTALAAACFAVCTYASSAAADDLSDGLTAFTRGDYQTAYTLLTPLASNNVPNAQLAVARMYHVGRGIEQNINEAKHWYYLAAQQGVTEAQFQLALIYLESNFASDDDEAALKWLSEAATKGHSQARFVYSSLTSTDDLYGC